jgi:hypothetical protein
MIRDGGADSYAAGKMPTKRYRAREPSGKQAASRQGSLRQARSSQRLARKRMSLEIEIADRPHGIGSSLLG